MDPKTLADSADTGAKAIDVGKRVAAVVKKEVPTATAALNTKVMKFNQKQVRPITEPVARAILEKGIRPVLDKAVKAKNAAAQWLESPDRRYNQTYKKDRPGVHFKEAARKPLTLKRTVAEPQKGIVFKGMPLPRSPETKPAIGDKRA